MITQFSKVIDYDYMTKVFDYNYDYNETAWPAFCHMLKYSKF